MDTNTLMSLIENDPDLSPTQKQELANDNNRSKLAKALSGTGGAGLGLVISKYLKLSKTAQVLLSAAGFGIGTLVYNYLTRQKFAPYNEQSQAYEIDTNRY